ncbi:hypothetical protein RND71_009477 [Anisodus tanguticus]|uniref:Uncharacterized protein n=1 Tax=Anisodus tanguticus TaxID=243964 RepID=A0AAE1SHT7_9SOLA|nr:hypothetical protein RND71_009477 [Anisodus tanguticus]
MRAVMKKEMSDARMCKGHRFFFSSILTLYLRHHEVFKEEADIGYRFRPHGRMLLARYTQMIYMNREAFAEPLDDDVLTLEPEQHEEPTSKEEAEVAAQASESDNDDGDSDDAYTGSKDEYHDNDDQSTGIAGEAVDFLIFDVVVFAKVCIDESVFEARLFEEVFIVLEVDMIH